MATSTSNAALTLTITGAASVPPVPLKRGEKTTVAAKAGQRYRVVKEGEEADKAADKQSDKQAATEAAKDVAASQHGQDLLLSYADGTQVVLSNFYEACKAEQCAVDMPGSAGSGASGGYVITGDSPVGAGLSNGGRLVYAFGDTSALAGMTQGAAQASGFTLGDSFSTYIPAHEAHGAWNPMLAVLGGVGATAALLQGSKAEPVPTVIHGSVVAGPVVAGNGLTAVAYKADGTVLATGTVNADGTFTLNVGNDYRGPVLVKISDTNAESDYWDEASNAPKDLSSDLRALALIPAAGSYNVSVNLLTELAVRSLGLTGGDTGGSTVNFANVSDTQIVQANQKVAAAVGLTQDLVLGAAPVAIITTEGVSNTQTNNYGRLLAALSGAEVGSSTSAVLDDLADKLQSSEPQATGQVLERLLEGAAKVNLVAAISDITNQKSTAITISAVSQDNRLSPAEMVAGVQVEGTAEAGTSVTIIWSDASGTATATGTRTVTADTQGQWGTSFNSAEMPALGATTLKASVGANAATRSVFLDAPLAPAIALTQTTGNVANLTRNGHVDVSGVLPGAEWDYSLDNGATWAPGSGSGFTATGDGAQHVLVRQNIGGHYSASSNSLDFELDATAPSISSGNTAAALDESASANPVIYTALASDPRVLSYSLKATGDHSLLSINTATGAVTLTGNPDYETQSSYSFTVIATDVSGNASEQAVTLAINNLDEVAPAITSGAVANAIDENSGAAQLIYTATSTDTGDVASGSTTYSLKATGDHNLLSVNTATGAVTLTGNPDYETQSSYSFTVIATDVAGLASEQAVTLGVNDLDEVAPTVLISTLATSLGANATAMLTFTLSEALSSFSATDVTVVGGTLSDFAGSGTIYTATFTPDAGLSGSATITVADGAITDMAGNSNTAASNTVSLVVDTQAPQVASITTTATSLKAGETATLSITLSEDTLNFAVGDLQAVGGTLSDFAGSGSSYTVVFTPDANRSEGGSVSATARSFSDAAGNTSQSGTADALLISINTVPPTAELLPRLSRLDSLGMGDATTIDITLSEKSSNFVVGDLTPHNGTLSDFTPSGDDIHYSVLFTPTAPYTGFGDVVLAEARFTNAAGNSSAASQSTQFIIDTTPPTVTITSDKSALAIGQMAVITFTFNKAPGDSFDATDISVNGGTLSKLVKNTGTVWTAHFTPTDGSTGQASITVAAGNYTDAADNQGTAGTTPTITIDTQGPAADSLLPGNATTVLPGHALVLGFNEVVHIGTGSLVLVNDSAGSRSTVAMTDASVVLSDDGKTLTITPATALVAGSQYHVEASPGALLDAAGNAWAGIAASSTWADSDWRFTAATPSVRLNKITADNLVNGAENVAGVLISGLVESNTTGMVAAFVAGDFTVTLTPQGGGTAITAVATSYTAGTGVWSLTLATDALVHGKTYALSVAVAGSTGAATGATATTTGSVLVYLSVAAPTLALLKDTGSSNSDAVTSNAIVSVSGLEAGAAWEYKIDSGSWTTGSGNQFTGASTDAAHTVQVRQTDAAGNVSSSGSLSFTYDTTAAKPVINAVATDNLINASEIGSAITGTAEAGASVQLVLGTGKQARSVSVTANGSGTWSHTLDAADLAALAESASGQTQLSATQTDMAGNTSYTAQRNLTVDTAAPTVSIYAATPRIVAGNPSTELSFTLSESSSDFNAADVTVTGGTLSNFAGSGKDYSATFTPTSAATTAGSVRVAAGAFQDAAGNANAQASNTIELFIDTVRPTVAVTSNLSTLEAGKEAIITFTLSEASNTFNDQSILVTGGSLGQLSVNAAGTVYTAVYTPNQGYSGAGSVRVASSVFYDQANNENADGTDTDNSVALTIQNQPITLAISSNKAELKAGETATLSFDFSSVPTGFAAADITVTGGTLGTLTTVNSTHYTATFTPTASAASGTASVSVAAGAYTSAGGKAGEGAKVSEITFDTLAPTLSTLNPEDNGYLAVGNALVATFTEAVSAGTGSIRLVDDTASSTTTYAITDSAIVIDGDTLTLTPSTVLVSGHNYHLSIDSTALVDAAGNAYVGIANATSWNFGATNLSTTLNPVTGDSRINADEDAAGPVVFSGTVSSANEAVLGGLLASDIVVKVTVPRNGGWNDSTDKIITCTGVTYDSTTGKWTATLPENWVYDGFSSNTTTSTLINGDTDTIRVTITGRTGTAAAGLSTTLTDSMTVDLSNPAQPTLTLASDTGSSNSDGITRTNLINVGALEAGGSWQYSLDNGDNWQTGTGSSMAIPQDGVFTVKVKQADAAGNESAERSLAVTLDTQISAPVVNAIATDDRINLAEATSAITGTADAMASVSLVIGANTRTVTANSSGVWSYTLVAADLTAIGQGNEVIQVTQTDKAGNTSSATSAVIEVDTARPAVTLANTGSASLLAGQSTTVTATLSELVANFTASNFTVSGGTLSDLKADSTGLVYTGTFTPDADSTTAGSVQVAAGAVADAAGNTNAAASTLALTINTVRPTVAVTSNVTAGTTLHAGDTATVTFTLSASSSDFTAADVTATGGTLSSFAGTGTVYTATYTPDADSQAPGSVSVASATFANAAANANADGEDADNNLAFAIATTRPRLSISSDQGTLGGGQTAVITFTFSEDPDTSFVVGDISTTDSASHVTGTLSEFKGQGKSYTALFTPTAGFAGAASITVASNAYTNADGSLGQDGATPALTIDAVAPTVAITQSATSTLGAGQTDTVTFDFSEAPGESFTLADVDVSGGTLGALSAVSETRYVATFTPTASAAGTAKISVTSARFADAAGNANADGSDTNNALAISYATAVVPAGAVTATDVPTLALHQDTGASTTDHITNNGVIDVGGLVAGATWEYSLDGGANWLTGSGTSFSLPSAAIYSALQVRQTDGVTTSNVGSLSGDAVDYRTEHLGNLSLALARDSGSSGTDGITYNGKVNVSGSYSGVWQFSVDNGLSWTYGQGSDLPHSDMSVDAGTEKQVTVLVKSTDEGGNTAEKTISFTLDLENPAAPNVTLTTDPSDGGAIVAATNVEPGGSVKYMLGTGELTSTYTPPTAPGNYTLKVVSYDVAGNGAQTNLSFTVAAAGGGPIELAAVALGNGGFVIYGDSASNNASMYSGLAVSAAGDVNGDGLADVIVGAPYANNFGGRSYVVFGNTAGAALALSAVANGMGGFVINGNDLGGFSGQSVSAAGDMNGDGLADLIVGVPYANSSAGRSYVVFGKTAGTAVELSAVANGAGGFVISGDSLSFGISGYDVSAAGDVNGDGLADLVVGAPYANNNGGRSYVMFGKTSGAALDLAAVASGTGGFVIKGDSAYSKYSGISVSAAGDVNGDGLADLIIGAYGANNNGGRSYVVFGKTSGAAMDLSAVANGTGGFVINGGTASFYSGLSVSGAGDVNGDGLADLIVGAKAANSGGGRSYVVFGKTAGTAMDLESVAVGIGGFVINGDTKSSSASGFSVSAAGDMNGDGLADLIVGAYGVDGFKGRSFVVFGKTVGAPMDLSAVATGIGGFVINGDASGEGSGYEVSAAGDVNGDGLADLIVGAPYANNTAGRSYLIFGNTTGAFAQTAVDWMGTDADDTMTDGNVSKTLVGGAGNDTLTATAASVLYGGAGNDRFTIDSSMVTALQSAMGLGNNVDTLSRIDGGSGIDTIVLSGSGLTLDLTKVANQAGANPDGGSRIDSVEVIDLTGAGNNTLVLAARDVQDMAGMNPFNSSNGWTGLAASVARHQVRVEGNAGDVLSLGSEWGRGGTASYGGVTYLVYNAGSGAQLLVNAAVSIKIPPIEMSAIAAGMGGFVINGDSASSKYSGRSVSAAGDVNGDGLTDLIVGAADANSLGGRSYVVFGKTSGAATDLTAVAGGTGGFVINGDFASSKFSGSSVSTAGDVNGDGLADLIVGAYGANSNGGRSYVVFGKTSGAATDLTAVAAGTGGFVINGQAVDDKSGNSVSAAGDVNGDGLADLIVGAPFANSYGGRGYVVFGKTSGDAMDLAAVASGTGGFVINGDSASSRFSGFSVSAAGDMNGDGLADLIVGAHGANSLGGRSYVIFGNTSSAFGQTMVNWVGTDGADTQSDGGTAQTLVAGAGNDSLTATAASVLYGGAGNDTFTINSTMLTALQRPMGSGGNLDRLARIDGGSGVDTLALSGAGLTFDMKQVANQAAGNPDGGSRIDSIERIDLTGSGNNLLRVTAQDVQALAGMNWLNSANASSLGWAPAAGTTWVSVGRHQLVVDGNTGDELVLGSGWTALVGTFSNTLNNTTNTYTVYNKNAAQLLVDTDVTVLRPLPIALSAVAAGIGGFVINGQGANDLSGYSVSAAGDVNGDGLADFIIGAQKSDPASLADAGRSYVVFGKTGTVAVNLSDVAAAGSTVGFVINGQAASDLSGFSVSGAGDVNGDGLADLLVGAYQSDLTTGANAGRSYVVFGKASGAAVNLSAIAASTGASGGFVINGQTTNDNSGWTVSAAGDVNGDGYADVMVGAKAATVPDADALGTGNQAGAGRAYVIFGKSDAAAVQLSAVAQGTGGFIVNGRFTNDYLGTALAGGGDINGDGLDDLVIGASGADSVMAANGTFSSSGWDGGQAFVVFGKTSTTKVNTMNIAATAGNADGFLINGLTAGDASGASVSIIGDVNGDGLLDIAVGAKGSDFGGTSAGRAFVVFGKTDNAVVQLSAVAAGDGGFAINGAAAGDETGYSVSSAGDINGDGLADLIVGAHLADPTGAGNGGRSYVVFGQTGTGAINLSAVAAGMGGFVVNGQGASDESGLSVSAAGDVDGDGLMDLLVGAPNSDPNSLSNAGRSYIIFGSNNGIRALSKVDQMGSTGVDSLTDNGTAQSLVAGAGNDTLTATAASVLYGGSGDDRFVLNQAMLTGLQSAMGQGGNAADRLARVAGGDGLDTLALSSSGQELNLAQIDAGRIASVEVIDLTGSGDNIFSPTASASGVLSMARSNVYNSGNGWTGLAAQVNLQQLRVEGNAGDLINLAANWSAGSQATYGGQTYNTYQLGLAQLLVNTAVTMQLDSGPAVSNVALTATTGANGAWLVAGSTVTATVTLSEAVLINTAGGRPTLALDIGGTTVQAAYAGASGNQISFTTTIAAGQTADGGIALPADGLALNGAVISDTTGNVATSLSFSALEANSSYKVDTLAAAPNAIATNGVLAAPTNAEAGATVEYRSQLTGGTFSNWSSTFAQPAADGTADGRYLVELRQTDVAGNVSASQSVSLDVGRFYLPIALSDVGTGLGGFVINGDDMSNTKSGYSVSGAGDVNGDGLADLIVGAPYANSENGRSYVVFGQSTGTAINLTAVAGGTGGFVIEGPGGGGKSGFSVSAAGDVNGDGLADLIVGHPEALTYAGKSYVVFGKTSSGVIQLGSIDQYGSPAGFAIIGRGGSRDLTGWSVSAAGDVNGDGLADLSLGAPQSSTQTQAGSSYVVFGKSTESPVYLETMVVDTMGGFLINGTGLVRNQSGFSVSAAGDVNGDGLADLIVGAVNMEGDPGYVVFGQSRNTAIDLTAVMNNSGGFVIKGPTGESGYRVSAAGDVNGDGLADLIVGAPDANRSGGRSYVVFGKNSGGAIELTAVVEGTGGFVITGESPYHLSGVSVSTAGDVNGDGLADLIVGASRANVGGRSYVVFGKSTGAAIDLSAVAAGSGGFVINGDPTTSASGSSVSAAGDVNGDGLADLIVGAPLANSGAGRSFVIFGGTSGAFNQTAVDQLGGSGNDSLTDNGTAQTLVAGAGNDTLTATAASVLYGGAGNDSFTIDSSMVTALQSAMGSGGNTTQLARIDGGSGIDTVVLSGDGLTFDLTQVANQAASNPDGGSRIESMEVIDLTGSGDNTLKLNLFDVLDLGSANLFQATGRQQLLVKGNAGDTVDLVDGTGTTGWTAGSAATIDTVSYAAWNHDTSLATVYVQTGVVVV